MQNRYFENKEFKENLKKYEEAQKNGGNIYLDSEQLIDIAEYYQSLGDIDNAITTCEYAMTLWPDSMEPLLFRSRIALLEEDDADKADMFCERISDTDKTDEEYYLLKAEIMIAREQVDTADNYLKKFFYQEYTDDKDVIAIDVACLFADYAHYEKAKKWLDIVKNKADEFYLETLTRVETGLGHYEQSKKINNKLLDKDPFSTENWRRLAYTQLQDNDFESCIQSADYALAIDNEDTDAMELQATAFHALGNIKKAIEIINHVISIEGNSDVTENQLGYCYLEIPDYDKALEHFRKAKAYSDKINDHTEIRFDILRNLAFLESHHGNLDEGLRIIDQYAKEIKKETDTNIEIIRAHMYLENDKISEAKTHYLKSAKLSGYNPKTLTNIAFSICDKGYYKLALRILKHIEKTTSDLPDNFYTATAYTYMQLKCEKEFHKYLELAMEKETDRANFFFKDIKDKSFEDIN